MTLNAEQIEFNAKAKALIEYIREQFPNGCDGMLVCEGCALQYSDEDTTEGCLCKLLEV